MKKNKPTVYAFIDSQNLNLGVKNSVKHKSKTVHKGWELDFKKFRKFLKDRYKVETAFIFIGNLPGNEDLYEYLQRAGFVLVLKPTTTFVDDDGTTKVKGNVDTDLVLYAVAKEVGNYDKAVVVSGDGDFLSLYDHLQQIGKLGTILVPNKYRYSQLLTKYIHLIDFVSTKREKLEKRNKKSRA